MDTPGLSLDVQLAPTNPVSEYPVHHSNLDTPGLSLDVQLALYVDASYVIVIR